jgi:hypothetical protein
MARPIRHDAGCVESHDPGQGEAGVDPDEAGQVRTGMASGDCVPSSHYSTRIDHQRQGGGSTSDEEFKYELERLRKENEILKKNASSGIRMKVSEKGAPCCRASSVGRVDASGSFDY